MIRRPPRSTRTDTLFPYTTLFRSLNLQCCQVAFFLEPRLAVPSTLPRQQHVHQRTRLVGVVDRQLHQPAGVGMDGRLAQLRRIHLAKALEAGHVDRAGHADRKSVVEGKSGSVRVDLGGGRISKKKNKSNEKI